MPVCLEDFPFLHRFPGYTDQFPLSDREARAMPAHTPPAPLRRRWFLALIVSLLVAVSVTAGVWFFLPLKEIAYAKVLVHNQMSGAVFQHPEANIDSETYLRSQVAYLRSPLVIAEALNDPEVAKLSFIQERRGAAAGPARMPQPRTTAAASLSPDDWILQQLKIDFPDGPQVPRLSLKLENPEEARLVIAAIIKAYFEVVVDQDKRDRARRLMWLEDLSGDAETRLAAIKKTNKGFAQFDRSRRSEEYCPQTRNSPERIALHEGGIIEGHGTVNPARAPSKAL